MFETKRGLSVRVHISKSSLIGFLKDVKPDDGHREVEATLTTKRVIFAENILCISLSVVYQFVFIFQNLR